MSEFVLISVLASMATSALAFYALKTSWGFSMVDFSNAISGLVSFPEIRRDAEIQPMFDMHPITDRSASVFLVYSLMEAPHTHDIASAWEGNYAHVESDEYHPGVCKFFLN